MSSVKVESANDSGPQNVARQSCTQESRVAESSANDNEPRVSNRPRQLFNKLDAITAELVTAKEEVVTSKRELEAAVAEVATWAKRLKAAEASVDSTKKAKDAISQEIIRALQDDMGGIHSISSGRLMAGAGAETDDNTLQGHQDKNVGNRTSVAKYVETTSEAHCSRCAGQGGASEVSELSGEEGGAGRSAEDAAQRRNQAVATGELDRTLTESEECSAAQNHNGHIIQPARQHETKAESLPYSHRPCSVSGRPPNSIEAQRITEITGFLQKKLRGSSSGNYPVAKVVMMDICEVDAGILSDFKITEPEDLLPILQRYLNLVLEGQLKGHSLHFGDFHRPWLLHPRHDVPSFRNQLEELSKWERATLQDLVPQVFFPLVNIMWSKDVKSKGLPSTEVRYQLSWKMQLFKSKTAPSSESKSMSLLEFVEYAQKWCNIEVKRTKTTDDRIMRLGNKKPFKQKEHNDLFYGRNSAKTRFEVDDDYMSNTVVCSTGRKRKAKEDKQAGGNGHGSLRGWAYVEDQHEAK